MKNLELEKIIKRLEKLDIREWMVHSLTASKNSISAETNGIEFYLEKEEFNAFTTVYSLSIKNTGDNFELVKRSNREGDKTSKRLIKDFYEKTYTKIKEYKMKLLEEKLDSFLTE